MTCQISEENISQGFIYKVFGPSYENVTSTMRLTGAAEHAEYVILAESVSWRQAEQQSVQCFLNDSPCEKPTHKIIQRVRKMKCQ